MSLDFLDACDAEYLKSLCDVIDVWGAQRISFSKTSSAARPDYRLSSESGDLVIDGVSHAPKHPVSLQEEDWGPPLESWEVALSAIYIAAALEEVEAESLDIYTQNRREKDRVQKLNSGDE